MSGEGDLGHDAVDPLHLRGAADQAAHPGLGAQALTQLAALHVEVQAAAGAVEHAGEVLQGERLGEVVAGPDAHGLDRGGHCGEGGHHHHADLGIAELDLLQQL
jgi:hypothetical protein